MPNAQYLCIALYLGDEHGLVVLDVASSLNPYLTGSAMHYTLDCEFLDGGENALYLLSMGIVAEDGRTVYFEYKPNVETFSALQSIYPEQGKWLRENVVPHFTGPVLSRNEARKAITSLFSVPDQGPVTVWAWYGAYDWVLFHQLWGPLLHSPRPTVIPHWYADLRMLAEVIAPDINIRSAVKRDPSSVEHNALADAMWAMDVLKFLINKR